METDEAREQNKNEAFREGLGKQLRFLQDIPQDQRTQRHTMQIEYYILASNCTDTIEKAFRAASQGIALHVAAAKLGDAAAFHAMLARLYFLSQVGPHTLALSIYIHTPRFRCTYVG